MLSFVFTFTLSLKLANTNTKAYDTSESFLLKSLLQVTHEKTCTCYLHECHMTHLKVRKTKVVG